jgi:CubicO group peptidase (beta-lactamase class C family)
MAASAALTVPRFIIALIVVLSAAAVGPRASAQSLTFSLFERYLDSLREQARIPSVAFAVMQDGVVWERGLGRPDLDAAALATPDTPYVISELSQVFGATLLLRKCFDQDTAELGDRVTRWAPGFAEPNTTLGQLLSHSAPGGGFRYDPERFAALSLVIEECADLPYSRLLADEIFTRLGMENAVPGHALISPTTEDRDTLGVDRLSRYATVLARLAVPYRVDSGGRASRTSVTARAVDPSTGIVASVRDLVRFDSAMRSGSALLEPSTRQLAWTRISGTPMGLGWFVQSHNGQTLVWQFGLVKDAYSSLILKVPDRGLTLILLANSDGLSAPFGLERGDVTTSPFAQLFLRLHAP